MLKSLSAKQKTDFEKLIKTIKEDKNKQNLIVPNSIICNKSKFHQFAWYVCQYGDLDKKKLCVHKKPAKTGKLFQRIKKLLNLVLFIKGQLHYNENEIFEGRYLGFTKKLTLHPIFERVCKT